MSTSTLEKLVIKFSTEKKSRKREVAIAKLTSEDKYLECPEGSRHCQTPLRNNFRNGKILDAEMSNENNID